MLFNISPYNWVNVYNDETVDTGGEVETTVEETPVETTTTVDATAKNDDTPKFTQLQLNKILADEKRKHQKTVQTQVQQLENFQKSKNLSDKERAELQTRIEELNNSLLTKEQLAAKEKEKLTNEHRSKVEALTSERDNWQRMFIDSTITRSITDEAVKADVYSPHQIVTILKGDTRLVEALDAEGNVIPGQFVAKVKMSDTNAEGKPTTLDLTVSEALKRMKDRSEEFGNLFKSNLTGGLNGSTNRGSGKQPDPKNMTPEQYREFRKKRGW